MSSIKKNYFYSAFITFLNIGFPIITIPYLTRVLGPESFGKINFFLSLVPVSYTHLTLPTTPYV